MPSIGANLLSNESHRLLSISRQKRKNRLQSDNYFRRSLPSYNIKNSAINLEWYVGGSKTVNRTFLSWHLPLLTSTDTSICTSYLSNWSEYHDKLLSKETIEVFDTNNDQDVNKILYHYEQIIKKNNIKFVDDSNSLQKLFPFISTSDFSGYSRWFNNDHKLSDDIHPSSLYNVSVRPAFQMYITNQNNKKELNLLNNEIVGFPPGKYWLISWAVVDQTYGDKGQGYPQDSFPQSHVSNIRTNVKWDKKNGNRHVKGKKYWPSDPISIIVKDDMTYSIESQIIHCAWWSK